MWQSDFNQLYGDVRGHCSTHAENVRGRHRQVM